MRAIHFMKIDYILTRKQMYIVPLFFILAAVVGRATESGDFSILIAGTYMMFVASVFSTSPFGYCVGKNRGFLLLLPATVRERVAGRFLYGLSFIAILALLCGILAGAYRLLGFGFSVLVLPVFLLELAIGIVITSAEFLIFYLFGEGKENWQYLIGIVRVAPGMALFFAGSYFIEKLQNMAAFGMGMDLEALAARLIRIGAAALAAALLLTVVLAEICVKALEGRDYA